MLRAFARVFAFLLAFALASCSTPRPLGEIQSFEAERALGEKTLPQFLRDRGGVYRDRDLTRYLNDIVERLTQNVAVPEEYQPLRVRVLNTRTPSAFALPGGAIFLSRGIIAFANDESQIAGVIAHEISHVLSRHSAKRIAANEQTLLDIARDLEQDLRGESPLRQIAIIEKEFEARQDDVAVFSREQELEADRLGLQMAAAAGYDPSRFGELLARMEAYQVRRAARTGIDAKMLEELGERSGYPKLSERLAALDRFRPTGVNPAGRDRLMGVIDGMIFDDRFQGGFVRDGVYWHPSLQFSFQIPSELVPEHGSGLRFLSQHGLLEMRVLRARNVTLDALAARLKVQGRISPGIERASLSGFPAIIERNEFNRANEDFISETAVIDLGERFVIFRLLTKPQDEPQVRPQFSRMLNSLRNTNAGEVPERRTYATRRIGVADTVPNLLSGSDFGNDGEAEFRALNGLGTGQLPPVGSWIKLIE